MKQNLEEKNNKYKLSPKGSDGVHNKTWTKLRKGNRLWKLNLLIATEKNATRTKYIQ